jgi:Fe-S cluster assembly protein SufD
VAVRTPVHQLSAEAVEALSAAKNEPLWLRQRRRNAWQANQQLAMPTGHEEEWRRTDLRGLDLMHYDALPAPVQTAQTHQELPAFFASRLTLPETPVGGLLMHQDGSLLWRSLDETLAQQGVVFCDLDTAVQQHAALVEPYFMTEAVAFTSSKFAALHGALWHGGTFLYVPPGVSVILPLRVVSAHMTALGMEQTHFLLIADKHSQVTVVQEQVSASSDLPGLHNGVAELYLQDGAQVTYLHVQDWSRRLWGFAHHQAVLGANSQLRWAVAALGSRLHWTAQNVALREPGSQAQLYGLMFADDRQHLDYQTQQDHLAPHTESDLSFKSVLMDRARNVFRGVIHLRPQAQQTNAYQSAHSLLLSPQARADALPILEIEADDVRCKHGSTTGRIDDEQVFYLMSRGLSYQEAQRLIVQGFFETIITEFPVEGVQETIRLALEARIS